ncbi:transporter substrate-binding domain-containing protein [Pseudomonas sp. CAU 1711]|uniref:substrate-binding periplasmic protein n=1 Tax=Pseudomonas sp. CAU 1711 TaxID=3140356 RepID=UPI0032608D7D
MSIRPLLSLLALLCSIGLAEAAPLRLVTGDQYPPFTGQTLPNGGMLTELVLRVLQEADQPPQLAWQPWKRGYQATLKGQYDATFPYLPSPEREAEFLFSTPLYETTQKVFSRSGEALEPAQLAGRRFCLPLGWQAPTPLLTLLESGRLQRHEPQDLATCARLVALGRDDFFVADDLLGQRAIRQAGVAHELQESRAVVARNRLHLIVPRNRPGAQALIERFNAGLTRLRDSGEYARIVQRHRTLALAND